MEYVFFIVVCIMSVYIVNREYKATKELKRKVNRYDKE